MESFWRKKTLLAYVLAVLVFIIHISTLDCFVPLAQQPFLKGFVSSVCRCAVPTFLVISGALFFRNYDNSQYGKKMKSRAKSLLVPYLAWNTIGMLYAFAKTLLPAAYVHDKTPFDPTFVNVLLAIFHNAENFPFWFIFNLIVFFIFAPLVYVLLKNRILGIFVILGVLTTTALGYGLPVSVFTQPESVVYFLTGAYIGLHGFKEFSTRSVSKTRIGILGVTACVLSRLFVPAVVTSLFVSTLLLAVYAVCLVFAFDVFPYDRPVRKFCEHSFFVYVMHFQVCVVVSRLTFLALPNGLCLNYLLTIVITLVLIEITAQLLKKYTPMLYNVLSGSRG